MSNNYVNLIQENLRQLYDNLPINFSQNLPGKQVGKQFYFDAFGEKCVIDPKRIIFGEDEYLSVLGLIVSVYALNACSKNCVLSPFKSFNEFPNSASHVSASAMPASKLLHPHVAEIKKEEHSIVKAFNGEMAPAGIGGIFHLFFTLYLK